MPQKRKSGGQKVGMVIPFLSHQVMDYLAALYVLQVGAQVGGRAGTVCYALGGLMLVSAAFSGRPLGGGRLPRPMHRFADLAVIVAAAAAPFVFGFTDEKAATGRLVLLAVALILLVKVTNYAHGGPSATREIARGLKENAQHAPRLAGRAVGRRMTKRRPGGR